MGFHIREGQRVELRYSSVEPEAVRIAIRNLAGDLGKVLPGVETILREQKPGEAFGAAGAEAAVIVIGTIAGQDSRVPGNDDQAETLEKVAAEPDDADCSRRQCGTEKDNAGRPGNAPWDAGGSGDAVWPGNAPGDAGRPGDAVWPGNAPGDIGWFIDRSLMTDETGTLRKEAFQLKVQDGTLYIAGTDRRGTVYGIYTFCEWMGVSPWYFFADVPVRKKKELALEEGYCLTDWPSVEYRGIFINDEEELEAWVKKFMGEPTIGVKTYERIFELLLRLKANYIWPAMHVNSFNLTPENGALADRMGIVVGTSHCDMLMRSNNREWKPWIRKKGYTDAVYDYSIEGRNREILKEYWRESVEQNRDFEVCYTLGMRGIHDSGFETKHLEGSTEEEIRDAKIRLLGKIIADQREILRDTLGRETMMTFIPYKEVLELYDNGLEIPEDMTLVWANDNYGYIRRYPSEKEKGRKGGNGIYYHNSYWSPPSMSYVFLCSIPLAHTRNELQKAWKEGIRKLWVLNCGAMKPLEQEITFFLRLAWEIGKPGALTADVEAFVEDWIDRTFTGGIGKQVSVLLNDFSQLTNVRKVENMDYDAFSQTAYGDEAAMRIHRYEELFAQGNALYEELPEEERDAFFELVLMRVHAAYFTNLAYYYGDRSTLMYDRGNRQGARFYTEKSREAEDARRRLLHYYNHVICGGKWNGILNPEGFPPPRAAMMPVCTPPLETYADPLPGQETGLAEGRDGRLSAASMAVYLWNEGKELVFVTPGEKWLEIGNTGFGEFEVALRAPEWVALSEGHGVIRREKRILVCVTDTLENREGEIVIENVSDGSVRHIPVRTVRTKYAEGGCVEETCVGQACSREFPGESGCVTGSLPKPKYGEESRIKQDGAEGEGAESVCALEEDGLVALEAARVQSGLGEVGDFRIIPRLGRMQGCLVEAAVQRESLEEEQQESPSPLCYRFMTESRGDCLLEIHRFPSLDSVGRIRVGISLDDGPVQIVETSSNDEWRGNWKKNVLNNVDRLYLPLPIPEPGMHRLSVWAVDRYFAFSRMVIYTRPRKGNNLAGIRGSQPLPEDWEMLSWCDSFYGKCELPPRSVFYALPENAEDTIAVTCQMAQAERLGGKVEPEWYRKRGNGVFEEDCGAVRIDAATALAQSDCAWVSDGERNLSSGDAGFGGMPQSDLWRHCSSESFGRSGIALYIRTPELCWHEQDAPGLHYRFVCKGGRYTLWMLSKFNVREEGFFAVGFDGERVPLEQIYGKGCLWRYEAEQIYRWVPVTQTELAAGEHVLHIYALASGMRYDRFYLTKGKELPPMDEAWLSPEERAEGNMSLLIPFQTKKKTTGDKTIPQDRRFP